MSSIKHRELSQSTTATTTGNIDCPGVPTVFAATSTLSPKPFKLATPRRQIMTTYASGLASTFTEAAYPVRSDLVDAVRSAARIEGHYLVTDVVSDKRVRILCEKHGGQFAQRRRKSASTGLRCSSTKSMDCEYSIMIRRRRCYIDDNDKYEWYVDIATGSVYHTHPPSTTSRGTHSARRLPPEQLAHVLSLAQTLTTPARVILQSLRLQYPTTKAGIDEVYNVTAKLMLDLLAGDNPNEAIITRLRTSNEYEFYSKLDDQHRIEYLFLAPKNTLRLLASTGVGGTFIADCTYKTNVFKMPLLNVVGITNLSTTIEAFLCFLPGELERDYTVAIDWISSICRQYEIIPPNAIGTDYEKAIMRALCTNDYFAGSYNFICIWHINQNILKKWKLYIGASIDEADNQRVSAQKEFHSEIAKVWQAPTEVQFLREWQHFITKYRERGEDGIRLANYITNTWYSVREQFVAAWSNNHRHYGNIATSRAEGAHAMLKKYIQVSTGNLFSTIIKLIGAIDAQYILYIESRDRDREHAYVHQKNDPFFAAIIHCIPREILRQVSTQVDLYRARIARGITTLANDAYGCSSVFTRTMGIPCSHAIGRRLRREDISQQKLTINDFSKQWWIGAPSVPPVIIDVDALSDDDAPGDEGPSYRDRLQQERARLVVLAISRIENATPTQLTVVSEQLSRPIERIFNPITVRGKGRPRGALGKQITPSSSSSSTSTRRNASHFEQVVLNGVDNLTPPSSAQWDVVGSMPPPSSQRLCGKCRRSGHNARTCDAAVIG